MIRSKLSILALSVLAMSSVAHAAHHSDSFKPSGDGGNLGLGVMFGAPTGLDLKYWLESSRALDFGLAYSFDNYGELMGNYLFEFPNAFGAGKTEAQFVPYVGIGAVLFFGTDHNFHGYSDSAALGIRIPLGVEFLPHRAPIGITAEIAPGIGVIPGTFGFVQGSVGARFYF
jgi:hypothetical protein